MQRLTESATRVAIASWFPLAILLNVSTIAAATAEDEAPGNLFCLGAETPQYGEFEDERGRLMGDLLLREIARQSVLLSARDELGIATRDEALREPLSQSAPAAQWLHVETQARHARGMLIKLSNDEGVVWEHFQPCVVGPANMYVDLAEKLEPLTRNAILDALKKAGYQEQQQPVHSTAAPHHEIYDHLRQVNLLDQYTAIRRCHHEIRAHGETPERLSILVRGYAHLGQLTQTFLSSMHRTFRARSLLYAQRMIGSDPKSPVGWWHRAYALSMAGLQRWSIEDLKKAAKLAKNSDATSPAWVSLIESYNKYDFQQLQLASQADDELSQVAGLLWFASVEASENEALISEIGRAVIAQNQYDLRVWVGMQRETGLSYNHQLTAGAFGRFQNVLKAKVAKLDGLPIALRDKLVDFADHLRPVDGTADFATALVEHSKSTAAAVEPSWALLGRMVEEQNAINVACRGAFMRDDWSVDSAGLMAESRAAYANHPYGKLISSLEYEYNTPPPVFQQLLKDQTIDDTNAASMTRVIGRIPRSVRFANMSRKDANQHLYRQSSATEFEYYLETKTKSKSRARVQLAKWTFDISPHSPYRYFVLITEDWEGSRKARLEENWEQHYGDHPLVALAFAKQYETQGDREKAATYYRHHVELVPSVDGYVNLARVLYADGSDEWLPTMEQALQTRDYGLGHAHAQVRIAATLMSEGAYDDALPYAKSAASSYSGMSLRNLAFCYEGLEKHDDAYQLMKSANERYDTGCDYYWCVRHGRPELEQAWEDRRQVVLEKYSESYLTPFRVQHQIYLGNTEKAYRLAEEHWAAFSEPWNALAHAMLAEKLGHEDRANELLQAAAEWRPPANQAQYSYETAVNFLQAVRALDKVDEDMIEKLFISHGFGNRETTSSYLGWHLINRGEKELAKKYLREPAGGLYWNSAHALYAQVKLRELGVSIGDIPRQYRWAFAKE